MHRLACLEDLNLSRPADHEEGQCKIFTLSLGGPESEFSPRLKIRGRGKNFFYSELHRDCTALKTRKILSASSLKLQVSTFFLDVPYWSSFPSTYECGITAPPGDIPTCAFKPRRTLVRVGDRRITRTKFATKCINFFFSPRSFLLPFSVLDAKESPRTTRTS